MRFTFNGTQFRICFKHDKSRRWSDHIGHTAEILPGGKVHYCGTCRLDIGGVPKAQRKRKTWCVIQFLRKFNGTPRADRLGGDWVDFVAARGRPNEDAGDCFDKTQGREHALRNAMLERPEATIAGLFAFKPLDREFRAVAWKAYRERKPWTVTVTTGTAFVAGKEALIDQVADVVVDRLKTALLEDANVAGN